MLSDLAHDHVLKVDDAAAINSDDAYFIAPYCEQGDVDDVISAGRIGVRRAIDIMLDVASGVSFIHGKGYIHRDLKPSNIFSDNSGRFVVGDFGSVVSVGADGYTQTGSRHTLLYRTPEEVQSGYAYQRGDIYQLGLVLYQLLGGHLPYTESDWLSEKEKKNYSELSEPENQFYAREIIESKILTGRLIAINSLPPWCSPKLVSIIRKCCKTKHQERYDTVATLIAQLNNIRFAVPDWRFEPEPVLYRSKVRYRLVEQRGRYAIQKMIKGAFSWRTERALTPSSLLEAVRMAEALKS